MLSHSHAPYLPMWPTDSSAYTLTALYDPQYFELNPADNLAHSQLYQPADRTRGTTQSSGGVRAPGSLEIRPELNPQHWNRTPAVYFSLQFAFITFLAHKISDTRSGWNWFLQPSQHSFPLQCTHNSSSLTVIPPIDSSANPCWATASVLN